MIAPIKQPMYDSQGNIHPAWSAWFTDLTAKKGTTAQRPSLGAQDAGKMYFDTTLAAAGKPIFWTGTQWVDSTGAAV